MRRFFKVPRAGALGPACHYSAARRPLQVPAIRANAAALRRAPSAYRVALYLASIMGIFPHICITSTQTHSAGALCSEISANRPCAALLFGVSAFTIFVVRGWKLGSLQDAQWVVLHLATFSGTANFRGSFTLADQFMIIFKMTKIKVLLCM